MSELRSLLDSWKAVDNTSLTAAELNDDIVELCRGIDQMKVLVADKTAQLAASGGMETLGYPSITAYLSHVGRMSAGSARRHASRVNAATTAPAAYAAWSDGRISTDQAGHLFLMSTSVPDEYPEAEDRLLDIIEPLTPHHAGKALEYWRQAVDGPGDLDMAAQLARRGLSLSRTTGGMRRVDGWLTQLAGEALEAAMDAHLPPPSDGDPRSARQRRHDALEEMANCHLAHENTSRVGGERPQIQLLTDLRALEGLAGGTHETVDHGDVIDVDGVRMIACDSSVSRIVLGPESEVVDVGRRTRVWTAAQRRAIAARDRGCVWEGCGRPAKWADIHHRRHWADGGDTSVENGVMLCRFHHVLTHISEGNRRRRTSG